MLYGFEKAADPKWIEENILNLYHLERRQTFTAWNEAAKYTHTLLQKEGFDAELIPFPADGKTVYQDKISPIGWDANRVKLTLLTEVPGITDPVLANYEREPLEVVKHSVSLPEGRVEARLVTQSQMKAGEDIRGAFILLDPSARPHKEDMQMLLDLGAYGWVSDYVENPLVSSEGVAWLNAGTEHNAWHVSADDRDFVGYQISPIHGFYLRAACENGTVMVRAESDGRRYQTTLPVVTAVLPGEDSREVWLMAHLYEPLIDDNSSGVIGSIEVMRVLREMMLQGKVRLRRTLRVVFASEMYGFAAYIESIGDQRRHVIGAINMDGLCASVDKCHTCYRSIEGPDFTGGDRAGGFAGNILLEEATEAFEAANPKVTFMRLPHHLSDDCCIGDSTVGIPTVWLYHTRDGFHHNSVQDERLLDVPGFVQHLSACAEWIYRMICMDEAGIRDLLPRAVRRAQDAIDAASTREIRKPEERQAFLKFIYQREVGRLNDLRVFADIPEIDAAIAALKIPAVVECSEDPQGKPAPWYEYCSCFRFERLTRGFPHDLANLPSDERFRMPGDILEIDLADVCARLTPALTLRDVLQEVEWDKNVHFSEEEVRSYLFTLIRLADSGYLRMETNGVENGATFRNVLQNLGIQRGNRLLLAMDTDALGYVEGGAEIILDVILETVGDDGLVLIPAYADSIVFADGAVNRRATYRPYDTRSNGTLRDRTLRDDDLAQAALKRTGLERSGHPSHEVFAFGGEGATIVCGHGFEDAPFGETSPLGKLMRRGGSLLLIGDSALERALCGWTMGRKSSGTALARYIDTDGDLRSILIKEWPEHSGLKGKAFMDAVIRETGWKVKALEFGMTMLYRIDM